MRHLTCRAITATAGDGSAGGYTLNLTLLHDEIYDANDCRYTGAALPGAASWTAMTLQTKPSPGM